VKDSVGKKYKQQHSEKNKMRGRTRQSKEDSVKVKRKVRKDKG
jgi:hypothetical protein